MCLLVQRSSWCAVLHNQLWLILICIKDHLIKQKYLMQEDSSHKHSQRTVSAAMCRKSWKRVTNLVFNQLQYNLRLTQNIEQHLEWACKISSPESLNFIHNILQFWSSSPIFKMFMFMAATKMVLVSVESFPFTTVVLNYSHLYWQLDTNTGSYSQSSWDLIKSLNSTATS